jgi:hypothetical protein
MVQYLPSPAGSYPYPNAGKGDLQYQMLGDFGGALGGISGVIGNMFRQHAANQQKQAFLKQLSDSLSPQPMQGPLPAQAQPGSGGGAPSYKPPQGGMGGPSNPTATPESQRPMMPGGKMNMQQLMQLFQMFGSKAAGPFAQGMAHEMYPPQARPGSRPQMETSYVDPKTGYLSFDQKSGYQPVQVPFGETTRAMRSQTLHRILEGDKDAKNHLANTVAGARIAKEVNDKMMPLQNAVQTYNDLSNQYVKLSKSSKENVQAMLRNPTPNIVQRTFDSSTYGDKDALAYVNGLKSAQNDIKSAAMNKLVGQKDWQDFLHVLPGQTGGMPTKPEIQRFQRVIDHIHASVITDAQLAYSARGLTAPPDNGLPRIGDLDNEEVPEGDEYNGVDDAWQ